MIQRQSEAIVLRAWPFQEADLLVSLFTREQGRIKGVARHAMRSRRRFGGALEPMTHVRASYAERPRQELVRLDAFEILSSPLSQPIDYARTAALQLVAEVLEEALPEQAPEDAVFRLALAVLRGDSGGPSRGAGHLLRPMDEPPDGLDAGAWPLRRLRSRPARRHRLVLRQPAMASPAPTTAATAAWPLSAESVAIAARIFRGTVRELAKEQWPRRTLANLQRFAVDTLERHLERKLTSARAVRSESEKCPA